MIRKGLGISIFLSFFFIVLSENVYPHSGRVDSEGCHHVTSTGAYHCHQEVPQVSPVVPPQAPPPQHEVSQPVQELLTVKRVIDGDTILLSNGARVRLIGIDAPEIHEGIKLQRDSSRSTIDIKTIRELGKEAKNFLKDLIEGGNVRLEFDVEMRDRYHRMLAYVFLSDGTFVNAVLVREGYAQVMTVPPNVKYQEQFLSLQREAREKRRGLWKIIMPLESRLSFIEKKIGPIVEACHRMNENAMSCLCGVNFDYENFILGQKITNSYESIGVIFSSPRGNPLLINDKWPGQQGDAIVVSPPFALGANNQGLNQSDPLEISFKLEVSDVNFYLIDVESDTTATFFNAQSQIVDIQKVTPQSSSGKNSRVASSAQNIRKILLTNINSGDGFALDDLQFSVRCPLLYRPMIKQEIVAEKESAPVSDTNQAVAGEDEHLIEHEITAEEKSIPISETRQDVTETVSSLGNEPESACSRSINFDNENFVLGQKIVSDYENIGVTFSSPRGDPLLINDKWPGQQGDAIVVSPPFALGANNQGINQSDPLEIIFKYEVSDVNFYLIDVESETKANFFNAQSEVVDVQKILPQTSSGKSTKVGSSAQNVRRIILTNTSDGDGFVLDNLQFSFPCVSEINP